MNHIYRFLLADGCSTGTVTRSTHVRNRNQPNRLIMTESDNNTVPISICHDLLHFQVIYENIMSPLCSSGTS